MCTSSVVYHTGDKNPFVELTNPFTFNKYAETSLYGLCLNHTMKFLHTLIMP